MIQDDEAEFAGLALMPDFLSDNAWNYIGGGKDVYVGSEPGTQGHVMNDLVWREFGCARLDLTVENLTITDSEDIDLSYIVLAERYINAGEEV